MGCSTVLHILFQISVSKLIMVSPPGRWCEGAGYTSSAGASCGWSGGAMVLGKLPVPGHPTIRIRVGKGPTALAVGAGGVVWTFLLSTTLSVLCLPLFGRRPDKD